MRLSVLITLLLSIPTAWAVTVDLSAPVSYGGSQDAGYVNQLDENSVHVIGNAWKAFPLSESYTITPETEITFSTTITEPGEIVGIALVSDLGSIDPSRSFQIAGSQTWGIQDYRGQTGLITIPVGQFYTGSVTHVALIGDDDRRAASEVTWGFLSIAERTPLLRVFVLADDAPLLVERDAGGLEITERAVISRIQSVTADALDPASGYQLSIDDLDSTLGQLAQLQLFIDQGRPGFAWTPISSVGRDALQALAGALQSAEDAGLTSYDGGAAAGTLQSALRTMNALYEISSSG